jgi:iron complex transport system substrate-binding protein
MLFFRGEENMNSSFKKKLYIIIFFIIFVLLSTYSIESYPKRIISLSPPLTESIYLLGAGDRIIANTVYCTRPENAKNKEKIGTLLKINIEKIVSLNPDLILASSITRPKELEKLKILGYKVIQFKYAKSFNEICTQFINLGELIREKEKAQNIIKNTKVLVHEIKTITSSLPKKKVFVQVGVKPLFTVSKNTFINDFIEFAGGINIASDSKAGIYSREKVMASNPDIIIIVLMGIEGDKEKKIWQNFNSINAVKNNNIFLINSYEVCSPTPIIFSNTLKKFIEIIHPEIEIKNEK